MSGMDAVVGAWATAVGAWATAVGDDGSGPEQARRVVRAMKSAQYISFDMAVVLLLRLASLPWVG